jgi:hypothetical protein
MNRVCKFLYVAVPLLLSLVGCSGPAADGNPVLVDESRAALTAVFQVNSGGSAVSPFSSDQFYSGGTAYSTSNAISTNGVTNAAPAAVYQTERYGDQTYTFNGLTANASYTVRLHFAEIYFNSAGQRVFNVSINGSKVLSNFDIYAVAGANTAYVRDFTATANSSGQIAVQYVSVTNYAKSSAIEILSGSSSQTSPPPTSTSSATPPPTSTSSATPPPTSTSGLTPPPATSDVIAVDSGGSAVGSFASDGYFSGGSTYSTTNAVSTSGVTNAAPAAVYQSERYGNFTYTLTGLTASSTYTVRLHFAEIYFTSSGQRVFNVLVNGTQVIKNLDIFAVAGANTALVRDFSATANSSGQITVQYVSVTNNAKSSGLEILSSSGSGGGTPVPPAPTNQPPTVASGAAANPNPVSGTTSNLSVLGADDGGESNLTYTWTVVSGPGSASFSQNGSNAAKNTVATFSASGTYNLQVTLTDGSGLTCASTVNVSVTIPAAPPPGSGWLPPGSTWKMIWNDEFNGSSVDTSIWNYWLPGQTRRAAVNQPSNTYVGGGNLTVRITDAGGQLTSGGLESKIGFGYGYFEVRAQVLGGWAGFWLQSPAISDGTGNPALYGTEMDIQEACCPGAVQHAVHWNGYDTAHQFVAQPISTALVSNQQNFNTYGLEWTPTQYKFWVNGQLSWTFTQAISQRNDEVIRLTQETTGDYCGGSCLYNIDYVRVYQAQ